MKDIPAEDFRTKSFISIAAGVPLCALESYLPSQTKSVIRAMPNGPCLVGKSATVFSPSSKTTEEDKVIFTSLFSSVGIVTEVPEKNMDAATGLSGSGPACESSARSSLPHHHLLIVSSVSLDLSLSPLL
jgi:pyrroline-5-carboxylate reductase